jgi:hypothetical protein
VIDKDKADVHLGAAAQEGPPKRALLDRAKVIVDNFSFMRPRRKPDSGDLHLGNRIATDISGHLSCPCERCREKYEAQSD